MEVSIIPHRPVTRSDLKQERSFLHESVSTVLQLVVALIHVVSRMLNFLTNSDLIKI